MRRSIIMGGAVALAGLPVGASAQPDLGGQKIVALAAAPEQVVEILRVPDSGLQPHAMVDSAGTIHLVYIGDKPEAGDVYYASKKPGQPKWSAPIRVNSQEGSAIAIGTIRGPRLALGKKGRVHVAWNGSSAALPRGPKGSKGSESAPMLYARMNDAGNAFESQRCVVVSSTALDGGGSVAADVEGRVLVGWHAAGPEGPTDEAARHFMLARSKDDGATFEPERAVSPVGLGACACCGTGAMADSGGKVHFLFRTAAGDGHRNMEWLCSSDHGETFTARMMHDWKVNVCPMSSAWIAEGSAAQGPLLFAWETNGQVYYARVEASTGQVSTPIAPSGAPSTRKHPSLAVDRQGRVLLAWTEGTGWNKGGSVAWGAFDAKGQPIQGTRQDRGGRDGVAVWNSVAAVVADGQFFVIY